MIEEATGQGRQSPLPPPPQAPQDVNMVRPESPRIPSEVAARFTNPSLNHGEERLERIDEGRQLGTALQAGERTAAVGHETPKPAKLAVDGKTDSKEDSGGSFFDCKICLDLARDPVVTCCGHLFCWPCLYRWLQVQEGVEECPVCKGEVTVENVTPIYGHDDRARELAEDDSGLEIPLRPHARRVQSWRHTSWRPFLSSTETLGSQADLLTPE